VRKFQCGLTQPLRAAFLFEWREITFGEMRESGCPRRADLSDRRTGRAAATASVSSSYVSEMGGGLVFANNA
jgi:hypothetical protein